jgi:hypothetical protein
MAYFNYAPVVNNRTGTISVNNCSMGPSGFTGHNSPHNVRYSCYNPPFIPIADSFSSNSDSLLYSSAKTNLCQVPQTIYSKGPYTYGPSQAASSSSNPINNGQVDTSLNCVGTFANRSNCYFNGENRMNSSNYTSNIQGTCAPFKQYVYNSNKGYHSQYDKKFYKYNYDIEKDYNCPKIPLKTKPKKESKVKEYQALNVPYDMIPNCQNCFLYAFENYDVLQPPKNLGPEGDRIRQKMKQCFIYDAEMPNGMTAAIAVKKKDPFCAGVFEAVQRQCMDKCTYQ